VPENPSDRTDRGEVFMVFPYMDHDMCGLLGNPDFKITHSIAKLFMKQILQGMDFIHAVSRNPAGHVLRYKAY
jgi:serine/threonine-protein kinase BUR1